MSEFDYGNARLRALKSRLLPRRTLEALAESGSVQGLLVALTHTPYRKAVEAALVRLSGMECLVEAVRHDVAATVGKARRFFPPDDPAGEMAALILRRYDLHNLRTMLRGLSRQVSAGEILASTLPVAELRPADLAELARAPNTGAAIDLLATWRFPLAAPLLEARAGGARGPADLTDLELALDRWHFETALRTAREMPDAAVLVDGLSLEADAVNVMTALRLVGVPSLAAAGRTPAAASGGQASFVGPGHVPFAVLAEAASMASVLDAVSALGQTRYGQVLSAALAEHAATGRLSVFEYALRRWMLEFATSAIVRDPLGPGVLLGYVAHKTNEVANLRAIAQGLAAGEEPDRIRSELLLAS